MKTETVHWDWLDTSQTMTLSELSQCCGMGTNDIDELVSYHALIPLEVASEEPIFSAEWVMPLRHASKLRLEFDLDMFTVAILLGKLNRIEILERQLRALHARLPGNAPLPF